MAAANAKSKLKTGRKPKAGKAKAEPTALDIVHRAAGILFSRKAEDMLLLDLRGLSSLTDYYLICTCQNEAQMRAALGAAQRALSREGVKALRSEYMPGVRWAVLDYGEFIIHIFEKQTRNYYSLERLWGDAKSMYLKAEDYALPDSGAAADGSADDDL